METGEAQWKERILEFCSDNSIDVSYKGEEKLGIFITQTLESLGRELAERKYDIGRGDEALDFSVSLEDIASVFKKYGVDIGGNK